MPTFEEMLAAAAAGAPDQDPMGYVPNAPSIPQSQPTTLEPIQTDPGSLNFPAPAPTLPDAKKNELATAQQAKQDAVNAAQQDKQVALGGEPSEQVYRNAAVARMTGAGKETASGIEADLINLKFGQLYEKYGDRAYAFTMGLAAAEGQFNRLRSVGRNGHQAIADSVISVASGFGNAIAGPMALVGGVLDSRLGTGATEYINQANEAIERTKSAGAQTRARANAQVTALQDRDSLAQYEIDKKNNGDVVATFQRWGREGLSAVGNAVRDPTLLAEGASQAIGSLLGIGPYAKGFAAVGQIALGKAAGVAGSQTLQQATAAAARTALINRGATMGAIGAVESGGSYVENARSDMTHEQLMDRSPMYAGLIADNVTQDQARATVLNRAGLLAAGMTAPLAVAAGGLVSKFAGKPLRAGSLLGAARNTGSETVEEAIQGGTGTLFQNLAAQMTSDSKRDTSQGVGAQIGTGALYGGIAAGGLQAPSIAKRSAIAAVTAAGTGAAAAVNALSDLGASKVAAQTAAAEAASPVSPAIIDQAVTEAVTGAPTSAVAIKEAINALDDTTTAEAKAAGLAAADQITSAMTLAPDELASLPEKVRTTLLEGASSRYELLNRMAGALSEAEDANAPVGSMSNPSTRLDIAVAFLSALEPLERATNNDAAMDKLESGSSAELILKRYRNLTANILGNTTVSAALTKAQNTLIAAQTNGQLPEITEANAVVETLPSTTAPAPASTATSITYIPTDNTSKGDNNARATPILVARLEAVVAQPWSATADSDAITAEGALVRRVGAPGGITKTSYDYLNTLVRAWVDGTSVPTTSAPATTTATPTNLTASRATTPSKAVLQTIAAASLDPLKANSASINLIASMATRGKLKLTVPQMEAVETVRAILDAAKAASAERARLGHTTINPKTGKPSVSGVSNEALTDTTPTRGEALSANTHAKGIHNAMRTGNTEVAKEKMGDFRQFVQAMLNKLEATNANTVKPESQPGYVSWNQNTKEPYNEVSPIVRAHPNSVQFAQTVAIDTQQLIDVYNGLSKAFPVLGHKPIKSATMVALLDGTVEEVVARLQAKRTGKITGKQFKKIPVVAPSTAITAEAKQKKLARIAADKLKTASKIKVATRNVDPTSAATQTAGDTSVAPVTIKGRFARLLSATGSAFANMFLTSHALPKKPVSRLTGLVSPLQSVTSAFKSGEAMADFTGDKYWEHYADATLHTMSVYLNGIPDLLNGTDSKTGEPRESMNKRLQAAIMEKTGKNTALEDILAGKSVLHWKNRKALNIVQLNEDNTYTYNQELIESAALATIQWYISATENLTKVEEAQAAAILKLPVDEVTGSLLEALNSGYTTTAMVQGVTQKIKQYWGYDTHNDSPQGFTDGIAEAVAKEFIETLIARRAFDVTQVTSDPATPHLYTNIYMPSLGKATHPRIGSMMNGIDRAVLVKPQDIRFFSADEIEPSKNQLRNPYVRNTEQALRAMKKADAVQYFFNKPLMTFYKALGIGGFVELYGHGDLKSRVLNAEDRITLEGQNRTVEGAYRYLMAVADEAQNVIGPKYDYSDQAVHFAHNMHKGNRLQQLGSYTPQANKSVREALISTLKVVDLTDRGGAHYRAFMLSMAQSLDIKIHKIDHDQAIRDVLDLFNTKLAAAITIDFADEKLEVNAIKRIKDGLKSIGMQEPTDRAVSAILEYARYDNARPTEKAAFKTSAYIEADGITNGAINSMVLFSIGDYDDVWVDRMKRGGLSFNPLHKTLNDYYTSSTSITDLYGLTTGFLGKHFANMRTGVRSSPRALEHYKAVVVLMDMFLPGFDIKEGQLVIGREVAKNPLTVTLYGAGDNGIAGSVRDAVVAEIYVRMSSAAALKKANPTYTNAQAMFPNLSLAQSQKDYDRFINVYKTLTESTTKFDYKSELWVFEGKTPAAYDWENAKEAFVNFKLDPDRSSNLRDNIRTLFVNPLSKAIKETVGVATIKGQDLVQAAVQIQGIYQAASFLQKYNDKIAEKVAANKANPTGYRESNGLSRDESAQIHREVLKEFPVISNGNQTVYPAGSVNGPASVEYSESLTGGLTTLGMVTGPRDPGVSGPALMTFAFGDGATIQFYLDDPRSANDALTIFDGVHMNLVDYVAQSELLNEAVYKSWQGNPFAALSSAIANSLPNMNRVTLTEDQQITVRKALDMSQSSSLEALLRELRGAAALKQAQANALAKVALSVDQLASGGVPYTRDGIVLEGDAESVAGQLNALVKIEWDALQPKNVASKSFLDDEAVATEETDAEPTNVVTYRFENIEDLMKTVKLSDAQRALYGQIKISATVEDYVIHVGSAKDLIAYAKKNQLTVPTLGDTEGTFYHGLIMTGPKIIYLVNPSPETIIHELLHAATLHTIFKAYVDPANTSPVVKAAIKRLEFLMDDFVKIEVSSIKDVDTREAFENVLSQINPLAYDGSGIPPTPNAQAEALGEFISWTLANQGLADILVKKGETKSLGEIVSAAIAAVVNFFQSSKTVPNFPSLLANITFNAVVIMEQGQPYLSTRVGDISAFMSTRYGRSERLKNILRTFNGKITEYIDIGPVDTKGASAKQATAMLQNRKLTESLRLIKYKKAQVQAEELGNLAFTRGRFDMNPQERLAFESIVSALALESSIDPTALSEAQALYTHLARTATYKTFMVDPDANDQNDAAMGLARYEFLMGQGAIRFDEQKRSSLMPVFMALAMVHEGLRTSLVKVDLPKSMKNAEGTFDARLENAANTLMDKLSQRMAGTTRTENMQEAMDALGDRIQDLASKQKNIIEQLVTKGGTAADSANARVSEMLTNGADAVVGAAERFSAKKPSSKARKITENAARITMSIVSEKQGKVVAEGVMAALNSTGRFDFIRNMASDIIGRTGLIKDVFDHIKRVRSHVEQNRQHYREILPTKIAEVFSRKLEDKVWSTIYKAVWSTDLAAVTARDTAETVLNTFTDPNLLAQRKATLEASIQASDPAHWNQIQTKSRQLANYMNTKELGHELLPNAYAVSRLYGQRIQPGRTVPNAAMVENIDSLISVYAYEALAQDQKDTIAKLVKDEKEGMILVLSYLQGQRKDEMAKASKGRARDNHIKGYAPSLPTEGRSMMVADDARAAELSKLGYTRVGNYAGSSLERGSPSRGYYYAPIQARMTFSQGSLQNIQQTASGVHPELGFSIDQTAGRITSTSEINAIRRRGREAPGNLEALRPIWDATGKIVAYERTLDPAQLVRLGHDTHVARMIGVDRGRQVEEAEAHIFNEQLMHALKDMYDKDTQAPYKNASQYVNLNDIFETNKDPVLADALNLITKESWAYGQTVFGGPIMVRRDLLKDVVGQRKASLTDSWNGISRFNPTNQAHIRNIATLIMGKDAYKWITIGETEIRSLVTNAKQIIVVKSVIIPGLNIISNLLHMVNRGVPLATIFNLMPKKLIEVHNYTKNVSKRIETEMQLRAVENIPFEARRLQAVLQSIDDANRRMTIWPLIEAGEFSSISDAGISRDELLLTQGRMTAYFSKLVDKLPQPVQDAGRHAFIAKDTALFQGLTKAVQYGDFLAKAIMYDDMITRQNKSKEEALGVITEEFVNYDRLLGRTHEYLEDIGLSWFYKYKIRSIKVALSVIRNNPLNALLSSLIPMPDIFSNAGTPLSDNLVSKAISGTLPYSMGPGMGFYAPGLHPVSQVLGMLR